jgi:branched-chain amino acid transport system substrate-binding protein
MRTRLFGLAVAAGLAALASPLAAAAQTVKIGVILSLSGPDAALGNQIQRGLELYVKEHSKDLPAGVKVELVTKDDTGPNPEVAKRLAQELITRDRVSLLTGVVFTPNAAAIAPLTAEAKIPFVIMNAAASPITRMSPYVVRVSFTQWQFGTPIGEWAVKQGWKKGYTAVSDFGPGYDSEASFQTGFKAAGGEMIGSVRTPMTTQDFAPFLQRIKDAKPDVLYVFIPSGPYATAVMKGYNDLGLRQAGVHLVGPQDLVPDNELANMGDIPVGITTSGNYSSAADRPANKAFIAAWQKAYGTKDLPDFMSVAGWDGMHAIFDVIKDGKGKVDADAAMKVLTNWKAPDSPRGPISIDPATRDIVQNVYIRKTEKVGGKLQNTEFETIPNLKDRWKELNPPK